MSALPREIAPIPGDAATISSKATRFAAMAEAISDAVVGLRTAIADTRRHESEALDQLAENAAKVADRLHSLQQRYDEAAGALTTFADDLETAQAEAQTLVSAHADAVDAEARYARELDYYRDQRAATTDPVEAADLNRQLLALTNRRDAQASQAADAQARFTRIVENLRASGVRAAHRMRDAADGDGFNDSAWDDFSGWVAEHADVIKAIHDVLQKITLALSLLSFVFPVLAPFALAAAALTAGVGLVLAATGQISWIDFALDALAVATMGVAAVASRTIAGVMTALKGTRVARLAAQGSPNALRVVTGSFNGVLKGRNGATLFGRVRLPSATWAREVMSAKGMTNAHFLRVAESARAGAGGPLDDLLLKIGRQEMLKIRVSSLVTSVAGNVDSTLEDRLPRALELLGESARQSPLGDVADWYADVKSASTWKIGS